MILFPRSTFFQQLRVILLAVSETTTQTLGERARNKILRFADPERVAHMLGCGVEEWEAIRADPDFCQQMLNDLRYCLTGAINAEQPIEMDWEAQLASIAVEGMRIVRQILADDTQPMQLRFQAAQDALNRYSRTVIKRQETHDHRHQHHHRVSIDPETARLLTAAKLELTQIPKPRLIELEVGKPR
jgi:hypothetical protein